MKSLSRAILLLGLGLVTLAPSSATKYELVYDYLGKTSVYHQYLQGTIEGKAGPEKIHLQFLRNAQITALAGNKYLLKEWGQKYQGSQINFSEFDLPGPGEQLERTVTKYGKVTSVMRYLKGHRYYFRWLVFPEKPIEPGKDWSYDYPINFDVFGKSVRSKCTVNYTLERVMNYKKHLSAKILAQGQCAGRQGPAQLHYDFENKIFFDIDQGREVDYQINLTWTKSDSKKNLQESAKIEIYSILEK